MKLIATTICLLVSATVCTAETCRNLHPIALHLGVCLNLDAFEQGATSEMFDDIRESGVTINNIAVEELELPVRGCRGAVADSGEALTLTLNMETFVLTGDITRRRLFRTRRGTFRATARNSVITCTIPIEGPDNCVTPENAQCNTRYGSYNVDFTGRLLGAIAKRRIRAGISSRIPREINRLVILALNQLLELVG